MEKQYDSKVWKFGEDYRFYEIFPAHLRKTPLERMKESRRHAGFSNLSNQIGRICSYGVQKAVSTSKLRLLDAEAKLYEIKHYEETYRYLCYIDPDYLVIVLLREFQGHKGSGNIHKHIELGKRILKQANNCLAEIYKEEGMVHDA